VKSLVFIPFAFIAGDQGFALFAPYLVLVGVVLLLKAWHGRLARGINMGEAPMPHQID
jgi:hypothetical protein